MQEAAKYQLRRMVLVNAGTNMHVPSARITAIDPRGGAAVLGDNGVGKTTTLRILPLFFGHLPSQIVAGGQGQEAMIRFILPTDASAIAFEYQRGSDREEDLRLMVIRRRSDEPDVPFYRVYRCGFRKDLFVENGQFLDDERTQLKATDFDIQTSSKLTTAEYRAVILRTPATSKEKERLRRYALEWSFGPRPLDNLDRLVAAMVKKHINFGDIVQVAVGLVQQDLGLGAERAKLTFKQGKGQIDLWLKTRQACVEAFKLAPKVTELEGDIQAFHAAVARFRTRRADVAALKDFRDTERSQTSKAIDSLVEEHDAAVAKQLVERVALTEASANASSAAAKARQTYEEQATLAQYFETHGARAWEQKVQELPTLRLKRKNLQDQVAAAEAEHSEATTKYERLKQEAATSSSNMGLQLEQSKQPHRDRYVKALEQIGAAEENAKKDAAALHTQLRLDLEVALEPLLEEQGNWKERQKAPAASEATLKTVQEAQDRLQSHMEEHGRATTAYSQASAAEGDARRAFSSHEEAVRKAKGELETAESGVRTARLMLVPNPGSLLAALRAHPDDSWKRNLAKVIRPELLDRDDLDPAVMEETGHTLYGWQLNTGVLAAADWADDELARKAVEAAESRQSAALAHLQTMQDGLVAKARALKDAEEASRLRQARCGVLEGQTGELKTAVAAARQRVETEKKDATSKAVAELARLKGEIDAVRGQQRALATQAGEELTAITKAYGEQRTDARLLHDQAFRAIDESIKQLAADLKTTLAAFETQLLEHLASKGVDVKRLEVLKGEASAVATEVKTREDNLALVERWRTWMDAGGPTTLASLKTSAEQAQEQARQQAEKLTQFNHRAQKVTEQYQTAVSTKEKRAEEIDAELAILAELELEFESYMASGLSAIDAKTTAKDLRGRVRADRTALKSAGETVHNHYSFLRQQLTGRDNAVQELVEASLKRVEESDILRASELCTCYKLIGPQVANNVNITLKTLLANIGAFQKAIQSFEREVSAFNRRLQAGLTEVRCFERIKDLRLDIITNFENLGFYKKLSRMDDILRAHATEYGKDYSRELPPDQTAQALGDFMSVLSSDGNVEVNLSSHITLRGSVTDNGVYKEFKRSSELENISSEGLTSLVLITLMTALLNTIRGSEVVHVPWVTDEVGKFDPKNFTALMRMLQDNRIDVVTASPELGAAQQAMFARRYLFQDRGRIHEYKPRAAGSERTRASQPAAGEAVS